MQNTSFWVVGTVSTLLSALGCEVWAALVHRYIWHGPLWWLHKSHHAGPHDVAPCPKFSRYVERNDVFALLHAAAAIGLIMMGLNMAQPVCGGALAGIGAGLTLFGLAYAFVHDAIIHKRVFTIKLRRGYWRRVGGAHLAHHRTGQAPFGLFFGPFVRRHNRRPAHRSTPPTTDLLKPSSYNAELGSNGRP